MRMFSRRIRDARGFTVMEAVSVLGIMTMVLVMVSEMFASGYNIYILQSARIGAEVGAVFAARAVSEATRDAMAVEASSTINGTLYTSDADTLVLKLPSIDSSNNVIAASYDYIAIFNDPSDSTLVKRATQITGASKRPTGTKLITTSNSVLRFRYNEPVITDSTRVQLYLKNVQTARATTINARAWTAIYLRNK